jgi:copper(I)-binding protein
MLMGLKGGLKAGDSFPITLKFQHAGECQAEVKVQAPGAASMTEQHDMGDMGDMHDDAHGHHDMH